MTCFPEMEGVFLPRFEFEVASTLGFSFLGFLASRLPRFFSLDMRFLLTDPPVGDMPRGVVPRGQGGLAGARAMNPWVRGPGIWPGPQQGR